MEEIRSARMHKLSLTNRKTGLITGVNSVISFDPTEILLETEQGVLLVKGTDLNVTRLTLDKGEVEVDGMIDALTYSDRKNAASEEGGLWNRFFK